MIVRRVVLAVLLLLAAAGHADRALAQQGELTYAEYRRITESMLSAQAYGTCMSRSRANAA